MLASQNKVVSSAKIASGKKIKNKENKIKDECFICHFYIILFFLIYCYG